jgi:hypothetical protein
MISSRLRYYAERPGSATGRTTQNFMIEKTEQTPTDPGSLHPAGSAICAICRRKRRHAWHLSGYYGIGSQNNGRGTATVTASVCALCYESVSHDALGKPRHPNRYRRALRRYVSNDSAEAQRPGARARLKQERDEPHNELNCPRGALLPPAFGSANLGQSCKFSIPLSNHRVTTK